MRDVNNGWLIRYLHSNTASAFFFLVSLIVFTVCFYLCGIFIIFIANSLVKVKIFLNILLFKSRGKGNYSNLFSKFLSSPSKANLLVRRGDKRGYASNPNKLLDSLSDEDFSEWFRGFVDAEGSFLIQVVQNRFKLIFTLCLHKDELPLLKYIAQRLGVGYLSEKEKAASYTISSKDELLKIFSILDKQPLNTSKNLNYIIFRQAYDLYFNRDSIKVSTELHKIMIDFKNQMNKSRVDYNQHEDHSINITPYWLLGFVEGDGYFSFNRQDYSLKFGIGQTSQEIGVLKAIQQYLLSLPGEYIIKRSHTNLVKLGTYNSVKGRNDKPMASLIINQIDFLINVLVPFFDNLTWLSKKQRDYQDWKLILSIIKQGKHFTDEGKELISLITGGMNNSRLSTNLASKGKESFIANDIEERVLKLLSTPSNYEVQPDGKILIKSSGTYLKGRGNVGVDVLDEGGNLIHHFDSIKDCALFFNVHIRTINRRLDSGSYTEFNGKNLVFKRVISLP